MKKEELFEAMSDLDEREVAAAGRYVRTAKRAVWIRWGSMAACLVLLLAAVLMGMLSKGGEVTQGPSAGKELKVVSAEMPEAVAENMSASSFLESNAHWDWWQNYVDRKQVSAEYQDDMQAYYTGIMEQLLAEEDENTVCSPLNIYLAVSMLAEVSDGNTQKQILDLLEVPDIETLRTRVDALWQSNFVNTPVIKSQLANSLWLNGGVNFNNETLQRLAETYRASSYSGDPGSEEMNKALQEWTTKNTAALLEEYTREMRLDPETVMALVSTLYYRGMWTEEFQKSETDKGVFHGVKGDTEVDMMHMYDSREVYWTDTFASLELSINDGGSMHFFLPQEGVDVNDLVKDPDLFKAMRYDYEDENRYYRMVNLTVPKFKVSEKSDLLDALKELGVTDALDIEKADFSPLTTELPLFISSAEHAAMVEIDEEGVSGAAYTELALSGAGLPPEEVVDFTLDRPFLFVVTGNDGSILFAGIVRNVD